MKKTPRLNGWFLLSLLMALFFGATAYFYLFQRPFFSYRWAAAAGFVAFLTLWPLHYLTRRVVQPGLEQLSIRQKTLLLILFSGFSIFFAVDAVPVALNHLLLKPLTVEITPLSLDGKQVELRWIDSDLGEIGYRQFLHSGGWAETPNGLGTTSGGAENRLSWIGLVGERINLVFSTGPNEGLATVCVAAECENLDLSASNEGELNYTRNLSIPAAARITPLIPLSTLTSYFLLALFLWLTYQLPTQLKPAPTPKGWRWLLYTLPPLAVWGFTLLVFWPAIIFPDVRTVWSQVLSGHFNDWQPVFYTLTVWLITRIYPHLVSVNIFQIVLTALALAVGLRILAKQGVQSKYLWFISCLFAVSPVHVYSAVLISKDLIYSLGISGLSIISALIVFSNGKWLEKKSRWILIAVFIFITSMYRHNGLPVAAASPLVLMLVYRKHWKPLLAGLLIAAATVTLIRGPIYRALDAKPAPLKSAPLPLHHITTHISRGVPLTTEERALMDQINPNQLHSKCSAGLFYFSRNTDTEFLSKNMDRVWQLAITLAFRDPLGELIHYRFITSQIWELNPICKMQLSTYIDTYDYLVNWSYVNDEGMEASFFPGLIKPFADFFMFTQKMPWGIIWHGSLYLYLLLFTLLVLSFRTGNQKIWLITTPVIIHVLVLAVVSIDSGFRYTMPVIIFGLFAIGLLFRPLVQPMDSTDLTSRNSINDPN